MKDANFLVTIHKKNLARFGYIYQIWEPMVTKWEESKKGSDIDYIIMASNSATQPLMHFSDIFLLPVHVSIAEIAGHSMPSLCSDFMLILWQNFWLSSEIVLQE
jgi:hypothetical protein